jgi:hypothetical protein
LRELAAVRLTAVDFLRRSQANSRAVRKLFEGLPDNVSGAEPVADDAPLIGMRDLSTGALGVPAGKGRGRQFSGIALPLDPPQQLIIRRR